MKRLVLLLFLVPLASAFPGDEVEGAASYVTEYSVESYNDQFNGISAAQTLFNYTYNATKQHNAVVTQHRMMYEVEVHVFFTQSTTGVWSLQLTHEGADIPGCMAEIATQNPGALGGVPRVYDSFTLHCNRIIEMGFDNAAHNHSVGLRIAVQSGAPNAVNVGVSVGITRQDTAVYPMDINIENLEFWLPLLFWLGLTLFFLVRLAYFPAIASTVMVIGGLLAAPPWSFPMGIMLVVLGVWIHVMAKKGVFKGVNE